MNFIDFFTVYKADSLSIRQLQVKYVLVLCHATSTLFLARRRLHEPDPFPLSYKHRRPFDRPILRLIQTFSCFSSKLASLYKPLIVRIARCEDSEGLSIINWLRSESASHGSTGIWFSGIMLASGARGPEFDSRNPPMHVGSVATDTWIFSLALVRFSSFHVHVNIFATAIMTRKTSGMSIYSSPRQNRNDEEFKRFNVSAEGAGSAVSRWQQPSPGTAGPLQNQQRIFSNLPFFLFHWKRLSREREVCKRSMQNDPRLRAAIIHL